MTKTEKTVQQAANVAYEKYQMDNSMPHKETSEKANAMKWRLAHINATIPGADFLTIQFEDFSTLPYRRDWQKVYADLFQNETEWEDSSAGNRWGHWQMGLSELVRYLNE